MPQEVGLEDERQLLRVLALGRSFSKGPLALKCRVRNLFGMLTALMCPSHGSSLFMNLGEGICLGQARPVCPLCSTVGQSHGAWMVCLKLEPNPAQINLSSVSARTYSHPCHSK